MLRVMRCSLWYSSDIDRSNSIDQILSLLQLSRWHTTTTDTQIHTNNTQHRDKGNTHHTTNPTLPTLTPRTPNMTIRIVPTNNLNITLRQIRSMSMRKRMLHLSLRERGKDVKISVGELRKVGRMDRRLGVRGF